MGPRIHAHVPSQRQYLVRLLSRSASRTRRIRQQSFFLLPLCAGLWETGRSLGLTRGSQVIGVAGLVTTPIVGFSLFECGSDIGGIAWLACALGFAIHGSPSSGLRWVFVGVCLGLAYGFKSLHLVATIPILGWIATLHLLGHARLQTFRQRVLGLISSWLGVAIGFLCAAGYWLTRNWVELGNPFYPVQLPFVSKVFGWRGATDFSLAERAATQFEWVRTNVEWWVYPWTEWHYIDQNFKHSSGFGPFVAAVVCVAIVVTLLTLQTRKETSARRAFLLAGGAFIAAVWMLLGDRQPRYLLGCLVFWTPLAGWFISVVPKTCARPQALVASVSILFMVAVLLTRHLAEFGDRFILSRQTDRWQFYEYPTALDSLPRGTVLLNLAGRTWNYPLVGNQRSVTVVNYLNARRHSENSDSMSETDTGPLRYSSAFLTTAGASYIFAPENLPIQFDDCRQLVEVDRYGKSPSTGALLRPARVLYRIDHPVDGASCTPARAQ